MKEKIVTRSKHLLVMLVPLLAITVLGSLGNIQVHATTQTRFGAYLLTTDPPYSFNYTAYCSDITVGCGASNSIVWYRGIVNINGAPTQVSGSAPMSFFRTVVYPDCTRYSFLAHPTSGPLTGGTIYGKACFGQNAPGTVVVSSANNNVVYGRDGTGSAFLWTNNPDN